MTNVSEVGQPCCRAFVTGATGFLGYQIVEQLIAAEVAVRTLSRTGQLPGDLAVQGVEVVRGGLDDVELLTRAMAGCDVVFHVAADVSMWRRRWAASVATNVVGTRNMVAAALRAEVERFVFTSTAATIGKPLSQPAGSEPTVLDESHPYNLHALEMVYPHTKWLAEQEVEQGLRRGLHAITTHPAAVLGPGDWKHNTLPLFAAPRRGMALAVPGGFRTICDVRDVARGHLLAASQASPGEHYILGGEWMSVAELFALIAEEVGGLRPKLQIPDRVMLGLGRLLDGVAELTDRPPLVSWEMALQSTLRVGMSSAKAERELGYVSRPSRQSIRDGAEWFRSQGRL
ncbi:MAG: NAD-dependent epimerase/dehydratase family protein [Deltaproteobacteria bacterium]|nr:NAD-dependent epimerase/dehydratase family protein [Deltaproteobacteria bacterium]